MVHLYINLILFSKNKRKKKKKREIKIINYLFIYQVIMEMGMKMNIYHKQFKFKWL